MSFFSLHARKKKETTIPLQELDPTLHIISKLGFPFSSYYIVGSNLEHDKALWDSSPGAWMAIFEKERARCRDASMALGKRLHVSVWHRTINDGFIESDIELSSRISQQLQSGSLDQFWLGTGIYPHIIKISAKSSLLQIMRGADFIMSNFKPWLLFSFNETSEDERFEIYYYLFDMHYVFFDVHIWEYVSSPDSIKKIDGYVLAVRNIDTIEFKKENISFDFEKSRHSTIETFLFGKNTIKNGNYLISYKIKSRHLSNIKLIVDMGFSAYLEKIVEVKDVDDIVDLNLMFKVLGEEQEVGLSIISSSKNLEIIEGGIYHLEGNNVLMQKNTQ